MNDRDRPVSDDDHVFAESNLHAYNEAAALNEQDLTADVNADQLEDAEAAEAALAIRTQQLGQEAIRNAKLEAALADTRQALAMLWQHYLLPISDEQKAQVVAALADTAKKETNEDTNT